MREDEHAAKDEPALPALDSSEVAPDYEHSARRSAQRPLIGVGAVILTPDAELVVLVKRAKPPALGKWSIPGGLVERGERLVDACQREIREETGLCMSALESQPIKLFERIIPAVSDAVEYHYLIVDFWGIADQCELHAESDVSEARWVRVGELAQWDTTEGLGEVIDLAVRIAKHQVERPSLLSDVGNPP